MTRGFRCTWSRRCPLHMLIHKVTYWGEWWHRAGWPPELQLWGRLRRAGPRGCRTACFHGCHKHTRARSACWCCSEWGSRCLRWLRAGSTCSSRAGWNLPSASGYWQCYLRTDANGRSLSARRCFTLQNNLGGENSFALFPATDSS